MDKKYKTPADIIAEHAGNSEFMDGLESGRAEIAAQNQEVVKCPEAVWPNERITFVKCGIPQKFKFQKFSLIDAQREGE